MLVQLCALAALGFAGNAPLATNVAASQTVTPIAEEGVKPYPLSTCLATQVDLSTVAAPVAIVHEQQEYHFASEEAAAPFRADPSLLAPRLAEEVARAAGK